MRRAPSPTPSSSPTREKIQRLLAVLALNTSCTTIQIKSLHQTEVPVQDGAEDLSNGSVELGSHPNACQAPEELTGESLPLKESEVQTKLARIREYVSNHPVEIPEFNFHKMAWDHKAMLEKEDFQNLLITHCKDVEPWFFTTDVMHNFTVNGTMVEDQPFGVTVSGAGVQESTLPVLNLDCELINGKGEDVGGLFHSHPKPFIMIEGKPHEKGSNEYQDIGNHEAGHYYHLKKWPLPQRKKDRVFRADELFEQDALSMLGIPECHPISYQMLNEMGADGLQIYLSSEDQAKQEWLNANLRRKTNYRATYFLMKNIFFEELGSEKDLEKRVSHAIRNDEVSIEDLRASGLLLFIEAERAISKVNESK